LFRRLCSPKPTERYSTTDALEHPWFNDKLRFPLTFTEIRLWNSFKPIFLCCFFIANIKKDFKSTKKVGLVSNLSKLPAINKTKLDKEKEKVERRRHYGKKLKLKQDNPELHDLIYQDLKKSPRELSESTYSNSSKIIKKSERVTSVRGKDRKPEIEKISYGNLLTVPKHMTKRSNSNMANKVPDPIVSLCYDFKD